MFDEYNEQHSSSSRTTEMQPGVVLQPRLKDDRASDCNRGAMTKES